MKVKLSKEILDGIRAAIRQSRDDIANNRLRRKGLIREIRAYKDNIKRGENLCSKLEVGLVIDTSYVRADLNKKRAALAELRVKLVDAEIHYALEKARCRVLHDQLDRFHEPFDPVAFRKGNS